MIFLVRLSYVSYLSKIYPPINFHALVVFPCVDQLAFHYSGEADAWFMPES